MWAGIGHNAVSIRRRLAWFGLPGSISIAGAVYGMCTSEPLRRASETMVCSSSTSMLQPVVGPFEADFYRRVQNTQGAVLASGAAIAGDRARELSAEAP